MNQVNKVDHRSSRINLKVLITTSGVGSRLGEFTLYTNKSLVKVGDKLVISHIVENYPEDTEFVITLGYFGKHVRDFLSIAYPKRKFEFVEITNYEGPGSSLGLSMLLAKNHLQQPFIFHASDTLLFDTKVTESPSVNWVAGSKGPSASQYASLDVTSEYVMNFHDKGKIEFDYLHIGLIGIFDYLVFWQTLEKIYESNPNDNSLNDLKVLASMKSNGTLFRFKHVEQWADMGNTESLISARNSFKKNYSVLEKPDESISFIDKSVIKFFSNERIVESRVERAKLLGSLVPEITAHKGNFFRYDLIEGNLSSNKVTPEKISSLLDWAEVNLWHPKDHLNDKEFRELCFEFYKSKTLSRITEFLEKSKFDESNFSINGQHIPLILSLLESVDFNWICDGLQTQFHGDFILDNIIETPVGFKLIDWRQDFAGNVSSGDMYYDLAKFNHSLIINHEIVNNNYFDVEINESNIYCDIHRKHELVESRKVLQSFMISRGLDVRKTEVLTSLIWLNMAPLHHHPFDIFLFNFGKLNLWRSLSGN